MKIMPSLCFVVLVVPLIVGTLPRLAAEPADLAEFARIKAWLDEEREVEFAPNAAPWVLVPVGGRSGLFHVGLEWEEPRQFRQVRALFDTHVAASDVRLEYWVHNWPPEEGRGGWTRTDSPYNGEWRTIRSRVTTEGQEVVLSFEPLGVEENPNAKNRPGFHPSFRQALKLRLVVEAVKPPRLHALRVFGFSSWAERIVWVESGCEARPPIELSPFVYNGRILDGRPEGRRLRLRLAYLEHPPESPDRTILTLRSGELGFGVALDDLVRERAIYVRDAGIVISEGETPASCEDYTASGRLRPGADIHSRVARTAEQSLERAMGEIPRLTMTHRRGRHPLRYIPVGFMGNREKYGIDFNGNVFISKHGSKLFPDERARMLWEGDRIWFRLGAGAVPDFREREGAAQQSLLRDYLPVVLTRWERDEIEFHTETFVTLLEAPLDPWKNRGDEPSVLLMRVEARNRSSTPKQSLLWFAVSPEERLRFRDRALEAIANASGGYAAPRLRAVLSPSTGELMVASLPAGSELRGEAALWTAQLAPGGSATLLIRIPFMTPTGVDAARRFAAVDYDRARREVIAWWEEATGQGMRLRVPDELLNRFHRSALQHILISVYRDVPTGLFMAPCGTYDYNMFLNETMMQVRLLDMRGLHQLARTFLEPALALQGSKPFPGRFRDTSAIFHGVRIDADHDYTHSGYNLNHGWTLWTASEHFLFTRDRAWFEAKLPALRKAADWILSERQASMQQQMSGETVWHYGLLPAGQLEDNEEWHYWFAVNAWAHKGLKTFARALEEVDPPQSRRLAQEAAVYREDIRRAVFRSMAATPVAPLRDGTWIPVIPPRTSLRGRDHGWIRNILYGAHSLIDGDVVAPQELAATWILKDLEDNLFMAPMSFSTAEQDWFSRGGITLQPNLVNTPVTYLLRDELPQALRAFYNTFAVSYYPDVHAFTEWTPSFGVSGGPFYKTSDEACFLTWLRLFLLREADEDTLEIAPGAPRRWFHAGKSIDVAGAATFFGPIGVRIESRLHEGFIQATVDLPPGFRARRLAIRLRHPDARPMSRAQRNGLPWTDFDARRERIFIPAEPGRSVVRAWY